MTLHDRHALFGGTLTQRELVAQPTLLRMAAPELLPTPQACARFARWALAGRPQPDHKDLHIVGAEPAMRAIVVKAAKRLPDPVVFHLVHNTIVALVGRRTAGWCAGAPTFRSPDEEPHWIVIRNTADGELAALFAHEAAHSWLSRVVIPLATPDPVDGVHDVAVIGLDNMQSDVNRARHEFLVSRLAAGWGFRGAAADVTRYAGELREARRKPPRKEPRR